MEHAHITIISTVVIAHLLALLSPGPDFMLVVKSAVKNSREKAIGVALGISIANGIYITLCIVGVGSLLAKSLIIMTILKLFGGLFLLYIAVMAMKTKKSDYRFLNEEIIVSNTQNRNSFVKEFLVGFGSGILNPKNIIFYLSIFSLVLTNKVGLGFKIGLGIWMTFIVFAWDGFIIYVLSKKEVKKMFSRFTFYIDKIAGTFLGFVGIKLIQSAVFKEKI
jgi:threonine/homoserine/homoserine lactone efflux protein